MKATETDQVPITPILEANERRHVSISGESLNSLKECHKSSLSSTKENKLQEVFHTRRNTYLLCIYTYIYLTA